MTCHSRRSISYRKWCPWLPFQAQLPYFLGILLLFCMFSPICDHDKVPQTTKIQLKVYNASLPKFLQLSHGLLFHYICFKFIVYQHSLVFWHYFYVATERRSSSTIRAGMTSYFQEIAYPHEILFEKLKNFTIISCLKIKYTKWL